MFGLGDVVAIVTVYFVAEMIVSGVGILICVFAFFSLRVEAALGLIKTLL